METPLKHFSSLPEEMLRSQLHPADYNPRTITDEGKRLIRRSIKKFGVVGGIVVNAQTGNTIVGGHQKVAVLDDLNHYDPDTHENDYSLRVELIDVDAKTEKELNITLNNPNVGGQWDTDALARIIPDIDYKNAGLTEEDLHIIGVDYLLQTEAENDTAAAINAMHDANLEQTRQQREAERAAQQQQESESEEEGAQGVDDFYDSTEGPDEEPKDDPETIRQQKIQAVKDLKAKVNQDAIEKAKEQEAYVVLSFDTWQAKADFVQRFGFNPMEKFIKGEIFDARCERVFEEDL